MFYQVRIFKSDGELEKTIESEELSKKFWDEFYNSENSITLVSNGKTQTPRWVKERLDAEFPVAVES
ncbi:MAG: hypothetical protein COV66_02895 [Nitrospinae bacterium CG11_big_fil_rev_8_21_14_0_20_45_15]|jgi:hypothetical protein|nr:MAG: hypothetical protein COV66_02895 [Nitrospinae bacterium CG11_big_fil_rev_8_21_14_0_20_45_15]